MAVLAVTFGRSVGVLANSHFWFKSAYSVARPKIWIIINTQFPDFFNKSRIRERQQEALMFIGWDGQDILSLIQPWFLLKNPKLLELKYHAVRDAVTQLGSVATISEVFIGFQQYLYSPDRAAWLNSSQSAIASTVAIPYLKSTKSYSPGQSHGHSIA